MVKAKKTPFGALSNRELKNYIVNMSNPKFYVMDRGVAVGITHSSKPQKNKVYVNPKNIALAKRTLKARGGKPPTKKELREKYGIGRK